MHVAAVGTFDVRQAGTVDACVALEPTTKDKPWNGREGGGVWKEGDGAEGWRKREARRNWGNERVKRAMRKDSCGWREGGEGGGQ